MVHFNTTAHQIAVTNKHPLTTLKFLVPKTFKSESYSTYLVISFFILTIFLCQSFHILRRGLSQPPYHTKKWQLLVLKSRQTLGLPTILLSKNCHLIKLAPLILTSSELTKEVLGRHYQRNDCTKPWNQSKNKSTTTGASVSSIFFLPKPHGIPTSFELFPSRIIILDLPSFFPSFDENAVGQRCFRILIYICW
jgi:hypothetical protein